MPWGLGNILSKGPSSPKKGRKSIHSSLPSSPKSLPRPKTAPSLSPAPKLADDGDEPHELPADTPPEPKTPVAVPQKVRRNSALARAQSTPGLQRETSVSTLYFNRECRRNSDADIDSCSLCVPLSRVWCNKEQLHCKFS